MSKNFCGSITETSLSIASVLFLEYFTTETKSYVDWSTYWLPPGFSVGPEGPLEKWSILCEGDCKGLFPFLMLQPTTPLTWAWPGALAPFVLSRQDFSQPPLQ